MADKKMNAVPEEVVMSEAPTTDAPEEIPAPESTGAEAVTLEKRARPPCLKWARICPIPVAQQFHFLLKAWICLLLK